ncbi:unnamed protein product [Microthlaspi erraticum]|uniref:Uncharacterized protein n=1 Tax=Microthlaspi erraticum TaxID=1685480 RepID=A0A6D2HNC4_9BRAS|nr:unnamed protein product [Microthlaspi erraticum]
MKWYIQGLVFGYLSVPQRTGRLGRGLEMGDGHQEHSINWVRLTRSSLWLLLLFFFIFKVGVASLALVELVLARSGCRESSGLRKSWYWVDRTRIQGSQTRLLQVNSTVSSIELSFLCLDSIESGGRAGASGLRTLPPSLRVVSPSLGSKERLCEALGQGASFGW